jgi:hypothetical protein
MVQIKKRLLVSKQATYNFDMEKFNLEQLNNVEIKETISHQNANFIAFETWMIM